MGDTPSNEIDFRLGDVVVHKSEGTLKAADNTITGNSTLRSRNSKTRNTKQ